MKKILISACLLGQRVRYDGRDARSDDADLRRWLAEGPEGRGWRHGRGT